MFSQLFGFGKGQLAEFWEQITQSGDEKLKGHPMCLEKHWHSKTIPLFIHGDGVEYASDSLLVLSFGCLASNLPTLPQVLWDKRNLASYLAPFELVPQGSGMWETPHRRPRRQAFGKGPHLFFNERAAPAPSRIQRGALECDWGP